MIPQASIIAALRDADRAATLALNDFGGAFSDAVMPVISDHGFIAAIYALLAAFLVFRIGWKKALVVLLLAALALLICDQVANLVKNSVARLRPCWDDYMVSKGLSVLEKRGSRFGFYSGHASTTAGIITVVICIVHDFDKKHRNRALPVLGVLWVLTVSISRVYVGKHFVGDIFVGMIAGTLFGFALVCAARAVIRKYFTNFAI